MFPFSSIQAYQNSLSSGIVTCVDTVTHYLQQIGNNQQLNAFIEVFADEALEAASLLDEKRKQGKPLGKLHGVVVAIKDVICYNGHKVSAASKMIENFTKIYHATAVEKLLAEDAIIIGRNNCDEFAMGSSSENSAFGVVKNALDESRVPGGSSGGSAVAVQAGMCMVSLGSDTGGSVRQPADFCGIVGLKPSYGRVSRYGLIAYASSFDQIGIFANTIEDAALTLEVIAGVDDYDSTVSQKEVPSYAALLDSDNKKYKLAYFKEALENEALDAEIKQQILSFIALLKAQGHTVEPINFEWLDYVVPTYYILTTAEASSNLSRFDGVRFGHQTAQKNIDLTELYKASRSEGFGKEVQRRIMLGTFVLSSGYYDAYFTKAQQVRQLLYQRSKEIFADYDAIISPTVPATAWKFGEKSDNPTAMYLADIYTVFANLVGIPAVSLPLFKHSNSMPFGLQVMCSHFEEVHLHQLSKVLMHLK